MVSYMSLMKSLFDLFKVLMDDINGYSLTECIHPPGLSIEIVKDFAKQLVNVLNHLHNKSVVHRDLQVFPLFLTHFCSSRR